MSARTARDCDSAAPTGQRLIAESPTLAIARDGIDNKQRLAACCRTRANTLERKGPAFPPRDKLRTIAIIPGGFPQQSRRCDV